MAFAYFTKDEGQLYKVCENEAAKANLNCNEDDYTVQSISDDLFNDIIKSKKWIEYKDSTVNITDIDFPDGWPSAEVLKQDLKDKCELMNTWANSNVNNPTYNNVITYINYIDKFDFSSLSFPLMVTWEEYCDNNSVPFFHPLQL